ncbi:MAG: phosphoribosylglycinamide formyltransferase 1 [Clostridia bacterium]|jgi:phosphoribosylglycinamide formyltransferase-1|nr:phosphoribosylglycinamide formyltransferase 1 [Clostridia bacterium]MDN5322822.1 phosphoribosylglycinamide formyltransferase 1 [Clostridia bacterium]
MRLRLAVLASGRGTNLQALIDASKTGEIPAEIAVVISDKKEAIALKRAKDNGIPAVYIDRNNFGCKELFESTLLDEINKYDCDLVCLAGFMRILSPYFLANSEQKIINIHPSLLPAFPGLHAQKQALEYGVKFSGCTVHFVDKGVDSGPIILQAVVPVYENDTEESLSERILREEHRLYPLAVSLIAQGRVKVEGRKVWIS